MQIQYGKNGNVSSIVTNIKSEDIMKKEGKERYQNMMKFFSEQFVSEREYKEGDKLIQEAKDKNIDLSSAVLIPHDEGVALCFGGYYNHKAKFTPYINFDCHNFFSGWTFSIGCFADVDIYVDSYYFGGMLACITKDCLPAHDFFLIWLFEKMEEHFYDKSFSVPSYKQKLNWQNKLVVEFNRFEGEKKYENLSSVYELLVSENKGKRVDLLKVNGISASDYIKKNRIYRYAHSSNDIFKMSLYFKKPYEQLHKYIERVNIAI